MQSHAYFSKASGLWVVKDDKGKCFYYRDRGLAEEMLKMLKAGQKIMGERQLMRMMENNPAE